MRISALYYIVLVIFLILDSPGARETRKIKLDKVRESSFCQV